jgi:hypothetical protein
MTQELISDGTQRPATCIIPQPYEEIGLSTKQIHDINDFRRLVLVYKQDFLYATTLTEIIEINQFMQKFTEIAPCMFINRFNAFHS